VTSLPCSALPRTLNLALLVLAWLSLPMWGVAIAGIWLFGDKGSTIATAGATVCSFALFAAFFAGRVDKFAIEPAQEREQAYMTALRRLGNATTRPQPALRRVSS
jgi:hypothetical protein